MAEESFPINNLLGTAKSRLHRATGLMRAALDADARVGSEIPEGRPA